MLQYDALANQYTQICTVLYTPLNMYIQYTVSDIIEDSYIHHNYLRCTGIVLYAIHYNWSASNVIICLIKSLSNIYSDAERHITKDNKAYFQLSTSLQLLIHQKLSKNLSTSI
jgi:hypothetical protein